MDDVTGRIYIDMSYDQRSLKQMKFDAWIGW